MAGAIERTLAMALSAEGDVGAAPQTIEISQPKQSNNLTDMLRQVAATSGRTAGSLIGDFVRTSFGPGKLSFDEYVAFGLYDTARYAGTDIRSFIGLRVMQDIWQTANYRFDLYGLVENKIAMSALLEAHGFPTIPITALFSSTAGYPSAKSLHTKEALKEFLSVETHYPLFGKPMDGQQSLGSASFARYDDKARALVRANGQTTPLDAYVDDVATHYGSGYILQPRVLPHPDTAALCGERLATVRVVTIHGADGPRIVRVCEKIPAGTNVADNYWRAGNLLVQLDPATGARGRAISGKGFQMAEHSHHPDSGAAIGGTTVPNWHAVCELALEGARLLENTALIGWDIAPVERGAVIVEVNGTPDLTLPQLADSRGILDSEMRSFLEERRKSKKAWERWLAADRQNNLRASFWN